MGRFGAYPGRVVLLVVGSFLWVLLPCCLLVTGFSCECCYRVVLVGLGSCVGLVSLLVFWTRVPSGFTTVSSSGYRDLPKGGKVLLLATGWVKLLVLSVLAGTRRLLKRTRGCSPLSRGTFYVNNIEVRLLK